MTASESKTAEREWVLTRIIDAPRTLVFKAWTDPAQMARWWGPRMVTTPVAEMDVRPGGAYRLVMRDGDGNDYPLKGVYVEVVEPERLVFTDNWEDHPPEWQKMLPRTDAKPEALVTVTFEEHDGKTKLTLRMLFTSTAVRDAMVKMGMEGGWSESLEKLEEMLPHA